MIIDYFCMARCSTKFESNIELTTIEGKIQEIASGPIAALESIKHLGTNGGGF